ncbi:alpha/beta hydrolase [Lichenihabitans sp. Uapishka_5]|uniref:alpha/beta hydrolase n=1 Tax=Lichenihabitans sp. Uapishka_5 TaxID=3037302 RepID=UPI0029E7FF6E|nr:alpha/beta hydrolase [Lichenihabitans sp. Uapishka_5]
MPRFFRRRAEGVFDPDEVRRGADDLARFVVDARRTYGLAAPVAVGYSNGANVAAVLLARHPGLLSGAALLRPMTVLEDVAQPGPDAPVLILSGAMDPIATVADARRLAEILRLGGARVRQEVLRTGHGLTPDDGHLVARWLSETEGGWNAGLGRQGSPDGA